VKRDEADSAERAKGVYQDVGRMQVKMVRMVRVIVGEEEVGGQEEADSDDEQERGLPLSMVSISEGERGRANENGDAEEEFIDGGVTQEADAEEGKQAEGDAGEDAMDGTDGTGNGTNAVEVDGRTLRLHDVDYTPGKYHFARFF
jgi:hypothetical protein